MGMKEAILALQTQLQNFPDLSYASRTNFVGEDPFDLIEKNKFPFYNIVPGSERNEPVEDMSDDEIERWVYPITIQFASSSMNLNAAIMGDTGKGIVGVLQLSKNLWEGVRFDKTLGGIVQGVLPGFTVFRDYIKDPKRGSFIGQGEMTLEFFEDIGSL
jgi:hypothetical protein